MNSEESLDHRQRYEIPIRWCLLSGLIILSFHSAQPGGRSILMPTTVHTLLSKPGDWHIPVTMVEWTRAWSDIPFSFLVCLGSIAIGYLTHFIIHRIGIGTGLIALVALSYGFYDQHFLAALLISSLAGLFMRSTKTGDNKLIAVMLVIILVLTVLTTLEIGYVLLFWCLIYIPSLIAQPSKKRLKQPLCISGICCLALLLVGVMITGLGRTLLRPFSAMMITGYPGMLDSLGPVFGTDVPTTIAQLLLIITILMCWRQPLWGSCRTANVWFCLSSFMLLGSLCSYYLWLSAVASLVCLIAASPSFEFKGRGIQRNYLIQQGATIAITAVCLIKLLSPGMFLRDYFWEGAVAQERIDPTEWNITGPVILLDLDRCSEWLDSQTTMQYPPVIDNRWDLYGKDYAEYATLTRDLKEMRALIYFQSDQQFGGYLHRIGEWNPAIVLSETRQGDAIRDLSMSPHWKMIGIDGQTTYFGRDDFRPLRERIQVAGQTFLNLEWPGKSSPPPSSRVIAASTAESAGRVSEALNAIRLPYAALRMLPEKQTSHQKKVQVWSYLELSYRMHRNTGRHSLLDEYRALRLIRELASKHQWKSEEIRRLVFSLRGLGLEDAAREIFPNAISDEQTEQLSVSSKDDSSRHDAKERMLRFKIRAGEMVSAEKIVKDLDAGPKAFYSVILSSLRHPLPEIAKSMYAIVEDEELPIEMKSELLFYLGCVAIEVGDHQVAVQALTQSQQIDPQSGLSPLRITYLQQLNSP